MHISEATVKYHVKKILNRLSLKKRSDLIAYVRRTQENDLT